MRPHRLGQLPEQRAGRGPAGLNTFQFKPIRIQARQPLRRRVVALVGEVEGGFGAGQDIEEGGAPALDLPAERTVELPQSLASLRLGLGVDQVGEALDVRLLPQDPRRVVAVVQVDPSTPLRADTRARLDSAMLTGVSQIALDGRILQVNRALCGMLGYTEAQLRERFHQNILHPDEVADSDERREQMLAGSDTGGAVERRYVGSNGETIWVAISSALTMLPHLRGGRVHGLAVTSRTRMAALPDVPTFAESGSPGFEVTQWYGMLAPARTPVAIVTLLNAEIARENTFLGRERSNLAALSYNVNVGRLGAPPGASPAGGAN